MFIDIKLVSPMPCEVHSILALMSQPPKGGVGISEYRRGRRDAGQAGRVRVDGAAPSAGRGSSRAAAGGRGHSRAVGGRVPAASAASLPARREGRRSRYQKNYCQQNMRLTCVHGPGVSFLSTHPLDKIMHTREVRVAQATLTKEIIALHTKVP